MSKSRSSGGNGRSRWFRTLRPVPCHYESVHTCIVYAVEQMRHTMVTAPEGVRGSLRVLDVASVNQLHTECDDLLFHHLATYEYTHG
jgi:hypothetical protein